MNKRTLTIVGALLVLFVCGKAAGLGKDKAPDPTAAPPTEAAATEAPTEAAGNGVAEYETWLRAQVGGLKDPLTRLGTSFTEAGENPALFVDSAWKTGVAFNLAALQVTAGAIRDKEAPDAARPARGHVLAIADALEKGATLMAQAIDDLSPDKMKEGMAELQSANSLVQELDSVLKGLPK